MLQGSSKFLFFREGPLAAEQLSHTWNTHSVMTPVKARIHCLRTVYLAHIEVISGK